MENKQLQREHLNKENFWKPCDLRKMDKWENQSVDDLLDLGPRPWRISRGVIDQHPTHIQ